MSGVVDGLVVHLWYTCGTLVVVFGQTTHCISYRSNDG